MWCFFLFSLPYLPLWSLTISLVCFIGTFLAFFKSLFRHMDFPHWPVHKSCYLLFLKPALYIPSQWPNSNLLLLNQKARTLSKLASTLNMVPQEPIIQGITWAPVLLQMVAQWWPLPILAYPLEAINRQCPNNLQTMMVSQNHLLPLDLMQSMLDMEPIHPCCPIPTLVPTLQMEVLLKIIVIHLSVPCLLTFLIHHHIITCILVCIQDQVGWFVCVACCVLCGCFFVSFFSSPHIFPPSFEKRK